MGLRTLTQWGRKKRQCILLLLCHYFRTIWLKWRETLTRFSLSVHTSNKPAITITYGPNVKIHIACNQSSSKTLSFISDTTITSCSILFYIPSFVEYACPFLMIPSINATMWCTFSVTLKYTAGGATWKTTTEHKDMFVDKFTSQEPKLAPRSGSLYYTSYRTSNIFNWYY